MRLIWYVALITVPVLILLTLASQDPYQRVQLNEVLALRQALHERGVGAEVIAYLDKHGGRNVSAAELAGLQQAEGDDIYFMLTSAKEAPALQARVEAALADGYITRAEAEDYHRLAQSELTTATVLKRYGF